MRNKGQRKFVALGQRTPIDEKMTEANNALKQKFESNNYDADVTTRLVDLLINADKYKGAAASEIKDIVDKINSDYDYKLLSRSQLLRLKQRLHKIAPNVAEMIKDSDDNICDDICDDGCDDTLVKDTFVTDVGVDAARKAINREIRIAGLDKDYLGSIVKMGMISRDDKKLTKEVTVYLGFENSQQADAYVEPVKKALSEIFEQVDVASSKASQHSSGCYEVTIKLNCVETAESEKKHYEKLEEANKAKEEEAQKAAKKRYEEEEARRKQAALEREAEALVFNYASRLAKCKDLDELDDILDEAEDDHTDNKMSDKQLQQLNDIYEEAKKRIESGVGEKDNSLFMKLKYERQLANANVTADIERIRKFIRKYFDEGVINSKTYEHLMDALQKRRIELM